MRQFAGLQTKRFYSRSSGAASPILEIVPLQLFAYYMTVQKGLDVDRPRNLVKSVTLSRLA